jgi:hypothetical protein
VVACQSLMPDVFCWVLSASAKVTDSCRVHPLHGPLYKSFAVLYPAERVREQPLTERGSDVLIRSTVRCLVVI